MKIDPNMGKDEITSCNGRSKRKGEEGDVGAGAGARRRQKQNVTMAMDVLDCPVCSKPLSPPIYQVKASIRFITIYMHTYMIPVQHRIRNNVFIKMPQCSVGHVVCCSCRQGLPESKCTLCSGDVSETCDAMERIVDSVFVPCKHGCAKEINYHQQEEHERECPAGPCFCPVPGCGFSGPTATLQDHFTGLHNSTSGR